LELFPSEEVAVIVDYNPAWPRMFESEKSRILAATGNRIVALEHIGSTAVVGLGAKPTIDILAGVRMLADAESCASSLWSIGYKYRPEKEDLFPERRYFDKPSYHLHAVEPSSDFWSRHIAFRNYLRTHREAAEMYFRLKRRLSSRYQTDREAYTNAKTEFIIAILKEAGYVSKDGAT
jgi:GrpB-like predicted nucleotidyltransferase (UPF0157 family)